MTTIEAIQQVIGNTRVTNLSDTPAEDAQILVRALNEAVQEWFDAAPGKYKRTTYTQFLAGPTALSSISVTEGSVTVGGSPFAAADRGSSVELDGDSSWNEVVGPAALLRPYLGSTGTVSGTLHSDAVAFTDFSYERMVTNPRMISQDGLTTELRRIYPEDHVMQPFTETLDSYWQNLLGPTGHPKWYRVDYVGGSVRSSNDALIVVRVAPRPEKKMNFEVEIDVRPISYTPIAIVQAQTLPISREWSGHLLPLIEAKLAASPLWIASREVTQQVNMKAMEAKIKLRDEIPIEYARPQNRCGTKRGW